MKTWGKVLGVDQSLGIDHLTLKEFNVNRVGGSQHEVSHQSRPETLYFRDQLEVTDDLAQGNFHLLYSEALTWRRNVS